MTLPDVRLARGLDHPWHVAINQFDRHYTVSSGDALNQNKGPLGDGKKFLYDAKRAAEEVPRLALLFGMERRGELKKQHHQCSHDHQGEPVTDNHLTCCLGVKCRECPFLSVIDKVQTRRDYSLLPSEDVPVTGEERDVLKSWTCVTHILQNGGDPANEGFILTEDDRMYWDNVYASLASGPPEDEESPPLGERVAGDRP